MKKMTKVIIPINENCLSTYLMKCNHYAVFTIYNSKIVQTETITPDKSEIEDCSAWFKKLKITDVVTYKVNPKLIHTLIQNKINVFVGAMQQSPQLLIEEYLNGNLKSDDTILLS
ncbi:MAG: hypothetical protein JEZ09_19745 [Salinivirgaceae bacterium]|nr:hypothetical protein [Salinivirgaceae bacterium]